MERTNLLVVDDESGIREAIRVSLGDDFDVFCAESGEEALKVVEKNKFDLVILDINMPGIDGLQTLKLIKEFDKELPVVMLSVVDNIRIVVNAMKLGASDYIKKPFDVNEVQHVVQSVLRKYNGLEGQNDVVPMGVQIIIKEFAKVMAVKNVPLNEAVKSFENEIRTLIMN